MCLCLVAQLCLILCDPLECSPLVFIAHGIFQSRNTGVGCHFLLQGIFLTQGLIPGLPVWLSWERICLQGRRPGFDPWVGKIPWRRERLPSPVFWPGEFHGLYSPRGCKESDRTEWLSLSLSLGSTCNAGKFFNFWAIEEVESTVLQFLEK